MNTRTGIKTIKISVAFLMIFLTLAVTSGCAGKKYINNPEEVIDSTTVYELTTASQLTEYSNLDISRNHIEEYSPESQEWKRYSMSCLAYGEDDEDRIKKIVEALGENFSKENIYYKILDYKDGRYFDYNISFCEKDDALLNSTPGSLVFYNNGDIYLQYTIGGKIHINFPERNKKIIGYEMNKENGMYAETHFFQMGNLENSFNIMKYPDKLEKEYEFNGCNRTLKSISEQVETDLKSSSTSVVYSDDYEYILSGIDVFKMNNDKNGFVFYYTFRLDSVPIYSDESGIPDRDYQENNNSETPLFVVNTDYSLGKYSTEKFDFLSSSPFLFNKPKVENISNDKVMGYKEALKIVSDVLTDKHVFTVKSTSLQYVPVQHGWDDKKPELIIEPAWIFELAGINVGTYSTMKIFVIADTGEIIINYYA